MPGRRVGLILLTILFAFRLCRSQEPSPFSACKSTAYDATTDRPTYSNATATTPCGVLEVTGGPERQWTGRGLHQDDYAQGVQFGLLPNVDLHYSAALYFKYGSNAGPLSGTGDRFWGVRYRFLPQTTLLPSLGTFYTLKVPTANPAVGLSSGRYDHTLSFLASKDVTKRFHLDLNVTPQWIGNAGSPGWAHNEALVLFASVPLTGKLTFVGGSYGFTQLTPTNPAYAVSSAGFDWQVAHRLILDASFDEGLTSAAPRKRVGLGFTYAPANVYSLFNRSVQVAR